MVQEWREIRDLFVDVNEKVLAPLDALDMTLEQVCVFVRVTVVVATAVSVTVSACVACVRQCM